MYKIWFYHWKILMCRWKITKFGKDPQTSTLSYCSCTCLFSSPAENYWNLASKGQFYRYSFGRSSVELVKLVPVSLHKKWSFPLRISSARGTPYLSVFSPNGGKYRLEKTPCLDTFHVMSQTTGICCLCTALKRSKTFQVLRGLFFLLCASL